MKKIFLLFATFSALVYCETPKMQYKYEVIYERIAIPPDLLESMDSNLINKYCGDRASVLISRSDGATWNIDFPGYEEVRNFELPYFAETVEGFSLSFHWGGGRYFWRELLFFKEIGGEPCLYKIDSTVDEYIYNHDKGDLDIETETKSRVIQPPIKISELDADKINKLFGGSAE